MYVGNFSINGFKRISIKTEVAYVGHVILAHIGLIGSFPSMRGEGRGKGVVNLCILGKKYSSHTDISSGLRKHCRRVRAKLVME